MLSGVEERQPLLKPSGVQDLGPLNPDTIDPTDGSVQTAHIQVKVYRRRWYIMTVYGLMAMSVCAVWNTFSPIAPVVERVFSWSDSTLVIFANYGPIAYLIGTPLFSWIIDTKGLRPACLLGSFLIAFATSLRCISSGTSLATPLIHVGQFLNSIAGPLAMGGPTAVSAEWFPPGQRTTATAIASTWNTLGAALSFVIGPYLVPDRVQSVNESTIRPCMSTESPSGPRGSAVTDPPFIENTTTGYDVATDRDNVMRYMYYSSGFTALIFLLVLVYFPSKPPHPPSTTASCQRLEYIPGLKQLARNRTFWLICLAYAPVGIQGAWLGVLDINVRSHGISQATDASLGFWGIIAGCVAALLIARGADRFARYTKWFLAALYIVSGSSFLVVTFALIGIIPYSYAIFFASYIVGSICIGAVSPLFFESACEVTYPVAEGVTTLVLTLVNNIAALVFLGVQMIPNIGTMWENWSLVGSIFVCVPVLLLMKQDYNRLDIDIVVDENKIGT